MDSAKQTYPHYFSAGSPQTLELNFAGLVMSGNIVVGGITYTAGTDFRVTSGIGGEGQTAYAFAEAVNGNAATHGTYHGEALPNPIAFACVRGTRVLLVGRAPGVSLGFSTTVSGLTGTSAGGTTSTEYSFSFNRGAGTTAYAAGQAISDHLSTPTVFSISGLPVGASTITKVRAQAQLSTWTAPIRIHLYESTYTTNFADQAAFPYLWANRTMRDGSIVMAGWRTGGAGSDASHAEDDFIRKDINLPTGQLFLRFECGAAQTPAASMGFLFEFTVRGG